MQLKRLIQVQGFIILSAVILFFGKPVFMPLAIAGMLVLVFMPLCKRLEARGCSITVSALICGFVFTSVIAGIICFVGWRLHHIAAEVSDIRRSVDTGMSELRHFLHDRFGMDTLRKSSPLPLPVQPDSDGINKAAQLLFSGTLAFAINLLLVLVYMIMLLCLRHQVRIFILRMMPRQSRVRAQIVISRSASLVQHYLWGLAIIIFFLWIMYGISFSLIGVQGALFFAILCGLLEIVPFVGNITGSTLTCIMALSQGGGFKMVASIIIAYSIIQFLQFYIISPLVMRTQLSIRPLFTILVLFAGELLWDIPGMILAIPALGIFKIICDNVEQLQPLGTLLGENKGTFRHKAGFAIRRPVSRGNQ